jgi:hypothetical protein
MTFLTVPYAEKDEARALGARWNPARKKWYVPPGVDLEPFAKWRGAGGAQDAAAATLAVGSNYVDLGHGCNPFEACAECDAKLAGSAWEKAALAKR